MPVDVDEAGATRRNGVGVITAGLPGHGAVCGDFYELELDGLSRRNGSDNKPVRIVRRQHGPDGCVPGCRPVTEFNSISRQKDIVAHLRRRGIVDGERDRNEFRSEHRVLDRV